jgi:PAS domain S-box-containing protein
MRAHRSVLAQPIVERDAVSDSAAVLLAKALFHGLSDAGQEDGLLARYACPALLVDANDQVIAANLAGAYLAEALNAGRMPELTHLIAYCIAQNAARHDEVIHPCGDGGMVETDILPTGDGTTALVLCHDVTLDRNLRAALSESRERYKDLVEIVSDFAWETGPDGRFVFVSPRGALGYTAAELIGRSSLDLVMPDRSSESFSSPFICRQSMVNAPVWMRHHDGIAACVSISAVPLFAPGGGWCGARGICRDVTDGSPGGWS